MITQLEGSQHSPHYYPFRVQQLHVRHSLDDLSTGGSDANGILGGDQPFGVGGLHTHLHQNAVLALHVDKQYYTCKKWGSHKQ